MLSGKKLPSLLIVAMGNPQGRCDLLPQTKQRFWWVDVSWDAKTWVDYMKRTWGTVPNSKLTQLIGQQYQTGFADTQRFNYITPRTVENLFRIARKIPREDQFWSVCDCDMELVDALYDTLTKIDPFRKLQEDLTDWLLNEMFEGRVHPWTTQVTEHIEACDTMGELRRYIAELEREGKAPEFIEFMKSTKTEAETDV